MFFSNSPQILSTVPTVILIIRWSKFNLLYKYNSDIGEVQEPTEEDESSKGWTYNLIRSFTSVWNQDPMIQEFEEDGSQRDGGAALQGRGSGIHRFVGQLCGERRNVRDRWPAS